MWDVHCSLKVKSFVIARIIHFFFRAARVIVFRGHVFLHTVTYILHSFFSLNVEMHIYRYNVAFTNMISSKAEDYLLFASFIWKIVSNNNKSEIKKSSGQAEVSLFIIYIARSAGVKTQANLTQKTFHSFAMNLFHHLRLVIIKR